MNQQQKVIIIMDGDASAPVQQTGFAVTTTAPAQTLTINSFGVSAETTIDWGDGNSNAYTGTAQRTHQYASAGDYEITIDLPENVTTFDIRDSKVTLNSADIADMVNVSTFIALSVKLGTFNSSDISAWRPSQFQLISAASVVSATFNSSDISAWRPSIFRVSQMPSGFAGTFDSADVSAWTPTLFRIFTMPASYDFTITDDTSFDGFISTTTFDLYDNALTQAQVDTILYSLYSMTTSRTATNGGINVGSSNAAPSGTFQAAASCPVTTSTPGKEVAHELLNDTCAVVFNTWATVTITG